MSTYLTCQHCGFECKGLTLHLKYKHGQTPTQYKEQFPNSEIFSSSVKQQMKQKFGCLILFLMGIIIDHLTFLLNQTPEFCHNWSMQLIEHRRILL